MHFVIRPEEPLADRHSLLKHRSPRGYVLILGETLYCKCISHQQQHSHPSPAPLTCFQLHGCHFDTVKEIQYKQLMVLEAFSERNFWRVVSLYKGTILMVARFSLDTNQILHFIGAVLDGFVCPSQGQGIFNVQYLFCCCLSVLLIFDTLEQNVVRPDAQCGVFEYNMRSTQWSYLSSVLNNNSFGKQRVLS